MKPFTPIIYVDKDEESYEEFHAIYAGHGLNPKYPDDDYMWLLIPYGKSGVWERHAIRRGYEYREPTTEEIRQIIKYVFNASRFTISR